MRITILWVGLAWLVCFGGGCASIRVTDPYKTATEQFLLSGATREAVDQLSADALRDRLVWVESSYLITGPTTPPELSFFIGEVRAKLLKSGVRLAGKRDDAQIVLEIRSGGVGIDRLEFLLGIPASYIPGLATGTGGVGISTPELAILKSTRQRGFASVAFVAYWAQSGELVTSSGPFVGRTIREDYWVLGTGPRTVGNIPPAQPK